MNKMALEEYKGVYVFAEQVDNKLSGIAFELLGKAKDLAARFNKNFKKYEGNAAGKALVAAGPQL